MLPPLGTQPATSNEQPDEPDTPMFSCPAQNQSSMHVCCKRLHSEERAIRRGISPNEENTAESLQNANKKAAVHPT